MKPLPKKYDTPKTPTATQTEPMPAAEEAARQAAQAMKAGSSRGLGFSIWGLGRGLKLLIERPVYYAGFYTGRVSIRV